MLGEVRSLIPTGVNIMALMATATKLTRQKVVSILGMINPVVVSISPHKPNILYWVGTKSSMVMFSPVIHLKTERTLMPRMTIFRQKYSDCASLYQIFHISLGAQFTEPIGAPNISKFRLVDMFTSPTQKAVKDDIIHSFSEHGSRLRIVVCTVAFGMGIDCLDVSQIVHWGPSADLQSYIQETGHAGRNGNKACALLLVDKGDMNNHAISDQFMLNCRSLLFQDFDDYNSAVDIVGCMCC